MIDRNDLVLTCPKLLPDMDTGSAIADTVFMNDELVGGL